MTRPPSIPDHTLRRPIGRGAYGEVWLARNVMGAPRAVKIVWRRQFDSDRPYEREFAGVQRYEPVSRSADGLVHVLHVGRNDTEGYFYYVMELADAAETTGDESATSSLSPVSRTAHSDSLTSAYLPRTLRSEIKRHGRLATTDCLRIALDVISGLAQLHRRGLVHRDVKPGNIIFVNGRAKLADLGLVTTGGEGRTFVGTEGYIPPEGPGSATADLYALGIVLYEASTGLPLDRFPDAPAEWFSDGAGDEALEFHEVILKACEGQRERRYQNADEMQADLALLQSGQSVRAVRALARRVARLKTFGLVAMLTLALAAGWAAFANHRAQEAAASRARETALRERAEAAEREGRERLHTAYLEQARATVSSGEMGRRFRTLEAVRRAAAIHNTPELRREAFAALALPDLRVEREIDLGGHVEGAVMNPAFTLLAVARGAGAVEVWSMPEGRVLHTLEASTNLGAHLLRFSADGRYLAFKRDHSPGGEDADLEVWNLSTTQLVVLARHAVAHNSLSFHPHLPRLLAGRPSGRIVTWDLEHGAETTSFRVPPQWSVIHSPDGGRFALTRPDGLRGNVEVHDATNGAILVSANFPRGVLNVSWHPDGRQLAVPCTDGSVNLMDAFNGNVRTLGLHKAQAVQASFLPDGDFLVTGGWDREINIWNLTSFQCELTAAPGGYDLQVSADGRQAAMLAGHRRLQIMDFSRGAECRVLPGSVNMGSSRTKFSPDSRWLAAPTKEGIAVRDLSRAGAATTLDCGGLGDALWLPGGDELIGPDETRLFRWRVSPGTDGTDAPRLEPLPIFQPDDRIYSVHLLARRQSLLTSGIEGLRLVPLTNLLSGDGPRLKTPLWLSAVAPDETWIAAPFHRSPVLRIFRVPDFTVERWLTNPAPVRALACAPSGDRLAVLTDTALCIWDTRTWQLRHTLPITANVFAQVSYSADGRMLMVTENARSSALRDPETLEPLLPLPVWRQPGAMSADGRQLAVTVEGRRTQLWNLPAVRARFRELGIDWPD